MYVCMYIMYICMTNLVFSDQQTSLLRNDSWTLSYIHKKYSTKNQ